MRRTLRRASALFRGGFELVADVVAAGPRPIPGDGWPVAGPVPGVPGAYVAFTHSGVTLGPPLGELLAAEILDGGPVSDLLRTYRPDRFVPSV